MPLVDPTLIGLISAVTALTASITGPVVSLYIGRAQIRAAVRSANRQRWIEEFRDTIAKFSGQVAVATQLRSRIMQDGRVNISTDADLQQFDQLIVTSTKIRLMTNPVDSAHCELIELVDDLLNLFRSPDPSDDRSIQNTARRTVRRVSDVTLAIIRQEWQRVQRGE